MQKSRMKKISKNINFCQLFQKVKPALFRYDNNCFTTNCEFILGTINHNLAFHEEGF